MGIDPHKNQTFWKWMLTADNPNGAKPLTFIPDTFVFNHKGKACGSINFDANRFEYYACNVTLLIPLCEFLRKKFTFTSGGRNM